MVFALYEAGSEDETFVRVSIHKTNKDVQSNATSRQKARIENNRGPIGEQRIVPHHKPTDFPLHASISELRKLIKENNDLFPQD